MNRPTLKIRKFTNPEKSFVTERYVVENHEDLEKLLAEFPQLNTNMFNVMTNWKEAINEGRTLLITDEHHMTGFPTYCFESDKNSDHPNSMIRID